MIEFIETLIISCIPAIITGVLSFIISKNKSKNEIESLKISNKYEIEKLIEQHKIDIESIREQHRLEIERKEKEHKYKLEILQKEHENELVRKEKEIEGNTKYNLAGNAVNSIFGLALNDPQIKDAFSSKIKEVLENR